MAEDFLDGVNIESILEKVGGKAVAARLARWSSRAGAGWQAHRYDRPG